MNRPITSTEIEFLITELQDQMALQANSPKHLEKN